MNAFIDGRNVTVTLSKRNLLALLHKLEMPGSVRQLCRACAGGIRLTVHVEDDATHYGEREVPAGPMHPETEAFIKEYE